MTTATDEKRERDDPCALVDMLGTGATYRQLDYWTRRGWFSPPGHPEDRQAVGSGKARKWTERERQIASLIVRLTRSGVNVTTAARIARDAVDLYVNRVQTEDGIVISWSPM